MRISDFTNESSKSKRREAVSLNEMAATLYRQDKTRKNKMRNVL